MLPLVDPPPDTRLEATLPRSPEITATDALAGPCAAATDTSAAAATTIAIRTASQRTDESVASAYFAATCL